MKIIEGRTYIYNSTNCQVPKGSVVKCVNVNDDRFSKYLYNGKTVFLSDIFMTPHKYNPKKVVIPVSNELQAKTARSVLEELTGVTAGGNNYNSYMKCVGYWEGAGLDIWSNELSDWGNHDVVTIDELLENLTEIEEPVMIGEYRVEFIDAETIKVGCQIITKAEVQKLLEVWK